jgi:HSP20 family molecular chaperone IbpA
MLSNLSRQFYDQRVNDRGDKYVIHIRADEYDEHDFVVTPRSSFNQLIVDGKHADNDNLGGYIRRELHKIFPTPAHVDVNRYATSYDRHTHELTIEMPYRTANTADATSAIVNPDCQSTFSYGGLFRNTLENVLPTTSPHVNPSTSRTLFDRNATSNTSVPAPSTDLLIQSTTKPFDFDRFNQSAFRPQILSSNINDNHLSTKTLAMSLDMRDYRPEDIKVTIKDQELIVKAERKIESDTRKSRVSFFQATSLPPKTAIESLKSSFVNGRLLIEAPYVDLHDKSFDNMKTIW